MLTPRNHAATTWPEATSLSTQAVARPGKVRAAPTRRETRVWVGAYLSVAILSGLGLIGKITLLRRLVPLPAAFFALAVTVMLLLPLFWPLALRFKHAIAASTLLALGVSFFVVFPKVESLHQIGRGTDQPDCIIVASNAMMSGHWPYQRSEMWSKNPMSCGPGWVAIQAPVTTGLGYQWNLAFLWGLSVTGIVAALGWESASEVIALLALCPGLWLAASDGTDFLTFGICIASLYVLSGRFSAVRWAWAILVGLVAQFRMPTLLIPSFMTKPLGKKASIAASAIAITVQGAFLIWNPSRFVTDGPLHVIFKFTGMHLLSPRPLPAFVEIVSPLLLAAATATWANLQIRTDASDWTLAAYLCVVLCVPALADLATKIHALGDLVSALGVWEGGLWLTACLPLVTLLLSRSLRVEECNFANP